MRVTIARRHFYIHAIEVEQAMSGVSPEPVSGASVKIGGITYPLMQVGAVVTRQDRRDFSAGEVMRAMRALGFTVENSGS
ncbi:SCO5918 family protein [Streptomyces sp. NBC_01537]|nr:SCO5918 family protein [Streptomyces sp. NBC_01262]